MIKITKITPIKCVIENFKEVASELGSLQKELTYNDTSAMFNLKALNNNRWLKENKPHSYKLRKKELEDKLSTCMMKFDAEAQKPWFHPGSIPYLTNKFDLEVGNQIVYPEARKVPWKKKLPFELYSYQQESLEKLLEAKHGCVSIATGGGKTALLLTLARELGLRTVIVTPSKSIFLEVFKKFEYHFGKSNVGGYGAGKKVIGKKFTVCVSKSLTILKPGTKEYDFFSKTQVVIGDESHLLAAETLESVFHGVLSKVPYRFFLSGTQIRGDGKGKLLESIIGKNVFTLTTKEAIAGGYICPVKFNVFEVKSKDSFKGGDPLKAKRKHLLYNTQIADVAAKLANSAWTHGQESTLILVEELCQIKMIVDRLNVPYEYVHSASKADAAKHGLETRKVDEAVEVFNKGEARVLIGTSCIATGTNMYPCHNTVNWVGGSSEVKTKQGAIGRSVRVLENSEYKELHKPKPFAKIYDFKIKYSDGDVNARPLKILEGHLQKRIKMYKETTNDINFIKV